MLINLSNHPMEHWDKKQLRETEKYGEIIDMPFPAISPDLSDEELNSLVEEYYKRILEYENPVVMIQGEFVFVYRLVTKLKKVGIKALASCSQRVASEQMMGDGRVVKTTVFSFAGYREY